ncbi:hypothetical protein DF182_02050 [Chitinophaga flava]|uniref:Uncharacterized protein n=1 Tax=Chitinophaga flava TaxID=2259036 RepID=A0A365XYG9_9BACT|nr:hypothetical protein DF182_02050 [Chitinophaga flava]
MKIGGYPGFEGRFVTVVRMLSSLQLKQNTVTIIHTVTKHKLLFIFHIGPFLRITKTNAT